MIPGEGAGGPKPLRIPQGRVWHLPSHPQGISCFNEGWHCLFAESKVSFSGRRGTGSSPGSVSLCHPSIQPCCSGCSVTHLSPLSSVLLHLPKEEGTEERTLRELCKQRLRAGRSGSALMALVWAGSISPSSSKLMFSPLVHGGAALSSTESSGRALLQFQCDFNAILM